MIQVKMTNPTKTGRNYSWAQVYLNPGETKVLNFCPISAARTATHKQSCLNDVNNKMVELSYHIPPPLKIDFIESALKPKAKVDVKVETPVVVPEETPDVVMEDIFTPVDLKKKTPAISITPADNEPEFVPSLRELKEQQREAAVTLFEGEGTVNTPETADESIKVVNSFNMDSVIQPMNKTRSTYAETEVRELGFDEPSKVAVAPQAVETPQPVVAPVKNKGGRPAAAKKAAKVTL